MPADALVSARRARPISAFAVLTAWHGLFAGAWIVAYATAEGAHAPHRFAGYVLLALLAVRLLAAVLARGGSSWALPWADTATWQTFRRRFDRDAIAAFAGRTPLAPLSGLALLVAAMLAGLSGLPRGGDELHEGLANLSVLVVGVHIAVLGSAAALRMLARPARA